MTAPEAISALRTSHTVAYRVTAYTPIEGVLADLPISGGSVSYDSGSEVRRSAEITVSDPTLWPVDPLSALSPVGSEIGVEYGVVTPSGTYWVPLIRGPVQSVKRTRPAESGGVMISVADRSKTVAEDRFEAPAQTVAGATYAAEITRLIRETIPGVPVLDLIGSTAIAPVLDIEKERWKDGVQALAEALGAEVYADRTGGFVIAPVSGFASSPVWVADAGTAGVLVSIDEELSRERVYNAVVASGERTDGTPPVYAKVVDDDPASPTFYGGVFGRRPYFLTSQLLTSVAQCEVAAAGKLDGVRGLHAKVSLTQITNPVLEPGVVITVLPPGGVPQVHLIDSVDFPLDPTAVQSISTRTISAGEEMA